MRSRCALGLLLLLGFLALVAHADLENTNILRTVDVTTQLVRDSSVITVTNKGTGAEKEYLFAIEDLEHLAFFEAQLKKGSKRLEHTIVERGYAGLLLIGSFLFFFFFFLSFSFFLCQRSYFSPRNLKICDLWGCGFLVERVGGFSL